MTIHSSPVEDIFRLMKESSAPLPVNHRIHRLIQLKEWIDTHRDEIIKALHDDLRKPAEETLLTEIYVATSEIKHALKHLRWWNRDRLVPPVITSIIARSWYYFKPRGVVLIITPWNFPINLTVSTLVCAIAAGNRAIVKPSSLSSHTGKLMSRMIEELFPPEEVFPFNFSREEAKHLLKLPFDQIHFIGSTRAGREIMAAAAKNLTPVTLELGGQNTLVIGETANIHDAVKKCVWGSFMNNGQSCIASNLVMVHKNRYDEFLELLIAELKRVYGATAEERKASDDYGRIINSFHFNRIEQLLHRAVEDGARIAFGGEYDEEDLYIEPTILTNIPHDTPCIHEEIFGPLLPVVTFESFRDIPKTISESQPLVLYLFSRDRKEIDTFLQNSNSGGVCINDVVTHFLQLNLPFGGIGNSGMGYSHGFYGFRAFSHERAVLKHHTLNPIKLLFPPYNGIVKKLIRFVADYL